MHESRNLLISFFAIVKFTVLFFRTIITIKQGVLQDYQMD